MGPTGQTSQSESPAGANADPCRDEEALIAEIEKTHGPLGDEWLLVPTKMGPIALKAADHVMYERFQEAKETNLAEIDKLVRKSLIRPNVERYEAICQRYPMARVKCLEAIGILAGSGIQIRAKK